MKTYVNSLMNFLDSSVCNFCAVETIKKELDNAGFEEIKQEKQYVYEFDGEQWSCIEMEVNRV